MNPASAAAASLARGFALLGGFVRALSSPAGRHIDSAGAFAEAILEEKEIAVVPGEDFGEIARNHIRLSFACSEDQIRVGLGRISDWVGSLS